MHILHTKKKVDWNGWCLSVASTDCCSNMKTTNTSSQLLVVAYGANVGEAHARQRYNANDTMRLFECSFSCCCFLFFFSSVFSFLLILLRIRSMYIHTYVRKCVHVCKCIWKCFRNLYTGIHKCSTGCIPGSICYTPSASFYFLVVAYRQLLFDHVFKDSKFLVA